MTLSWKGCCAWLGLASALAMGEVLAASGNGVAQIVPDATLGAQRTVVTPNATTDVISGGATRGANLFHSFSQFSVPTGRTAYFNNALQIQNIISRVTGASVSNIDGLIKANGVANLFLINPNGIVFGPNARLNIGGSFVVSTANSLKFADGTAFSAKTPQATPLLTVSVPIGLQFGANPESITNRSQATDSSGNTIGLQVKPGKSLVLVGGNVILDKGNLLAWGGRVELGGLSAAGTVGLNGDGSLTYPAGVERADVSLNDGGLVDVTAQGGGSIVVNARNLDMLNSNLNAGIKNDSGSVGTQAGDVNIDATGAVTIAHSNIVNNVQPRAIGKAGNINITAESLDLMNSGGLNTRSYGQGNAGSISIFARDAVSFDSSGAFSSFDPSEPERDNPTVGNTNQLIPNIVGKSGDIYISAGSISLTGGSLLLADTHGIGDAGKITLLARDQVSASGVGTYGNSSDLISGCGSGCRGNGGNISITAG